MMRKNTTDTSSNNNRINNNANINTNPFSSNRKDANTNAIHRMTASNIDGSISSSSSSTNENSTTNTSGANDDTVFEGIVQLINQVNKQVQEKSTLQGNY